MEHYQQSRDLLDQAAKRQQTTNSFKTLHHAEPPINQNFAVVAIALFDDPQVVGISNILGVYKSEEKARQRTRELIAETGHPDIFVLPTCRWNPLRLKDKVPVETVPLDLDGKLVELNDKQKEREKQIREEQDRISRQIVDDRQRSEDPTTMEHYQYNWYAAIRNYSEREEYRRSMDEADQSFKTRTEIIRKRAEAEPSLEKRWLGELAPKLQARKEDSLLLFLGSNVEKVRAEIFGPDGPPTE